MVVAAALLHCRPPSACLVHTPLPSLSLRMLMRGRSDDVITRQRETVANLGFGGPEGNDLMVCSSTHCFIMKTGSVGATHKDQAAGVAEGAASL